MKLIILTLLISLNCLAQHKVVITKENEATLQFEEPTLNKAVKRLKKIILSKRRFKGEWSLEESGNIFKREKTRSVATGIIREDEVLNIETGLNETITVPEYEEETYFEYYKPSNFSISIEDITQELLDKKTKRELKAKNKKELKELLEVQDLDLKQINKLLREMI
jgi:hypothetical protein